ncbi:MAG TPA: MBL fold metallo-hydrolase [Actinomycetota bacterium]|nr:MBL fold metallo-hydrolase [Actinomycetota bacterium]
MASPLELPGEYQVQFDTGELTFIGNATVLVRYAGFTFLTDPNFLHQGDHAKLGYGLRSERLMEPAMQIADLPPLDFIVLSHHHGDHIDEIAIRELDKELPIITNDHAARKLRRQGFKNAIALQTWESQWVRKPGGRVRITSMPGQHAPQPLQTLLPNVMGSMREFFSGDRVAFRMYITGDTLLHDKLEMIPKRYPDIDLALIHLGGTRILGILLTMDGSQGVRALQVIKPKVAVPIHYNDYTVMKDPLSAFKLKAEEHSLETEIRFVSHGDVLEFASERAKQLAERS